jgi:hypothetical protein
MTEVDEILEEKFVKVQRERVHRFVTGDHARLRRHLYHQMLYLSKLGVLPNWENFTKYGTTWTSMKRCFTEDDARRYEECWNETFDDTCGEWSPLYRG